MEEGDDEGFDEAGEFGEEDLEGDAGFEGEAEEAFDGAGEEDAELEN